MNLNDQKPEGYWTNAKLCRLVQSYPCFYDRAHPQYLKKDVVDKSWAVIAKEVKDSVASCKERWRNIRTAFARSINAYRTPAGPNRTKRYYLHDELQFLAKHITPGIPIRNQSQYEDECENQVKCPVVSGEEWPEEEDTYPEEDTVAANVAIDTVVDDEYIEMNQSPASKRRRTVETPEYKPCIRPILEQFGTDYDVLFLKGLLPEMRAMNFRQKITFKRRIYQVVEELLECPQESTTTAPVSSASFVNTPSTIAHQIHSGVVSTAFPTMSASNAFPVRTITIQTPRPQAVKTVLTSSELNLIRNLSGILSSQPSGSVAQTSKQQVPSNSVVGLENSMQNTAQPGNEGNSGDLTATKGCVDAVSTTSGQTIVSIPVTFSSSSNVALPNPMASSVEGGVQVKDEPNESSTSVEMN